MAKPTFRWDPRALAKAFRALPWWKRAGAYLGLLVLAGLLAAWIGFRVLYSMWATDLPDISWAERYRPPIVSDVLSGDDQLLGEFYLERRRVVPYDRIPKKLVQAFIAAEDSKFFDHGGFDVAGIARAAVQNVIAGRKKSGASTLTQQTAKAILISTWGFERATAKTFQRKFCELLLARELEARFTKEEILFLYLNQVYLGHSSYGVQAAAENYFRKNVWQLTLGEMSLLAGLPQAPSKYSPFKHPERAKNRRVYVLGRMLEEGMVTKAQHDEAKVEEVVVHPVEDFFRETAPFVTEHVRRDLVERYTNQRLLNDGLKVYATVDLDLEREAIASTLRGLGNADKRQGFHGLCVKYEKGGKCAQPARVVPKGGQKPGTKAYDDALAKEIAAFRKLQAAKGAPPVKEEELEQGQSYVGIVTAVEKEALTVGIGEALTGRVPVALLGWARKPNAEVNVKYAPPIIDAREVAKPGDVVLVRLVPPQDEPLVADLRPKSGKKVKQVVKKTVKKKRKGKLVDVVVEETVWVDAPADAKGPLLLALDQEIELQGSLVSLDPRTGYVVAMIGGSDFDKSEFNRAFQACRQPGSAFKPLYYSAALSGRVRPEHRCSHASLTEEDRAKCVVDSCEKVRGAWVESEKKCYFTPATPLLDAPIVYDDEVNATRWKPSNFEEQFLGDVPLRDALVNSMNIPAVKVLEAVGVREAAAWANHLGISTKLNEDLSIALGSSCVTLWDLVRVYGLFNRLGERVKATFIRRVVDRDGNLLEDHSAPSDPWIGLRARMASGYAGLFEQRERVIEPDSAYVLVDLLRQVAERGTAASAKRLGRDVAGKTGTTNDAFDAWFMGFSPELVTGVWVGYDTYDRDPMAKYETGGSTALPIWIDFMGAALKGRPAREFERPEGVVSIAIDKQTAKVLPAEGSGVLQVFKAGTQPTAAAAAAEQLQNQTGEFFRSEDF